MEGTSARKYQLSSLDVEAPAGVGIPPAEPVFGDTFERTTRSAVDRLLANKRVQSCLLKPKTRSARAICLVFWVVVLCGLGALAWWLVPLFLRTVVAPIQHTIKRWNPVLVAFIVVAGVAIVPIALIPAGPFIWLAAVSLGIWKGLLVVQVGTALGMSVSYFLGKQFLRERVRSWVEKKDWAQALFIAVKEAGPFKVVLLMRLGPAPYAWLSYACSLSPDIRYWPYIAASFIGRAPHNLIDIYIGGGVSTAGEAAEGEEIDPWLITFYAVGFCMAVVLSIWSYVYAKRALRDLRARAVAREQVLTAFSFPELDEYDDEDQLVLQADRLQVGFRSSGDSIPLEVMGIGNGTTDKEGLTVAEEDDKVLEKDPRSPESTHVANGLPTQQIHLDDTERKRSKSGSHSPRSKGRYIVADCTLSPGEEESHGLLHGQEQSS